MSSHKVKGDERVHLEGGRFDGSTVAPNIPAEFVWIGGNDRRPVKFRSPGPERQLYRLVTAQGKHKYKWFCAHHTHRICECGGINEIGHNERRPRCEGCGAALPENEKLCAS